MNVFLDHPFFALLNLAGFYLAAHLIVREE